MASSTQTKLTIRLSTYEDIPAVLAISNTAAMSTHANFAVEPETLEYWQESWRETSEFHPCFVAEMDDANSGETRIIGFAKSSPWKGRCAYNWSAETTVYVETKLHGRGIGKQLYLKLIETMRAQGYRSLLGGIAQPNEASVKLHESCGYKKVALLEKVGWKFDEWHDVGYWQLKLCDDNESPKPIKTIGEVIK